MRLCYRGNTYYRSNNQINPVDSVVAAKYRGVNYDIDQSNVSINLQPNILQYRGITYLKSML